MRDRFFVDTNIFVYAFLDKAKDELNHRKHLMAKQFLNLLDENVDIIISVQVCNEYYSALYKNKTSDGEIQESLRVLMDAVEVVPITSQTVLGAFEMKNRYRYSYWDALILSSAVEHNCQVIYSEDMRHQQEINKQLKIINPLMT